MPVWIDESALSRPEEKHRSTHHPIRAVEFVDGTSQIDGSTGMSAPENRKIGSYGQKNIQIAAEKTLL